MGQAGGLTPQVVVAIVAAAIAAVAALPAVQSWASARTGSAKTRRTMEQWEEFSKQPQLGARAARHYEASALFVARSEIGRNLARKNLYSRWYLALFISFLVPVWILLCQPLWHSWLGFQPQNYLVWLGIPAFVVQMYYQFAFANIGRQFRDSMPLFAGFFGQSSAFVLMSRSDYLALVWHLNPVIITARCYYRTCRALGRGHRFAGQGRTVLVLDEEFVRRMEIEFEWEVIRLRRALKRLSRKKRLKLCLLNCLSDRPGLTYDAAWRMTYREVTLRRNKRTF